MLVLVKDRVQGSEPEPGRQGEAQQDRVRVPVLGPGPRPAARRWPLGPLRLRRLRRRMLPSRRPARPRCCRLPTSARRTTRPRAGAVAGCRSGGLRVPCSGQGTGRHLGRHHGQHQGPHPGRRRGATVLRVQGCRWATRGAEGLAWACCGPAGRVVVARPTLPRRRATAPSHNRRRCPARCASPPHAVCAVEPMFGGLGRTRSPPQWNSSTRRGQARAQRHHPSACNWVNRVTRLADGSHGETVGYSHAGQRCSAR